MTHPDMRLVPVDVSRLVIAARIVAYEDQSPETLKALDIAAEQFADRVPWEDGPDLAAAPHQPQPAAREPCKGCGYVGSVPEDKVACCPDGRRYDNLREEVPEGAGERQAVVKAVERAVLRACNRIIGIKDIRQRSAIAGEEIDTAVNAILSALRVQQPAQVEAVECENCDGEGSIEYEGGDGEGWPSRPERDTCLKCKGEGRVAAHPAPVQQPADDKLGEAKWAIEQMREILSRLHYAKDQSGFNESRDTGVRIADKALAALKAETRA